MKAPFRIGDRVTRNKAVGSCNGVPADMGGTVVKITVVVQGSGGTRARIRVRWDNGYTGSVDDRQIVLDRTLVVPLVKR